VDGLKSELDIGKRAEERLTTENASLLREQRNQNLLLNNVQEMQQKIENQAFEVWFFTDEATTLLPYCSLTIQDTVELLGRRLPQQKTHVRLRSGFHCVIEQKQLKNKQQKLLDKKRFSGCYSNPCRDGHKESWQSCFSDWSLSVTQFINGVLDHKEIIAQRKWYRCQLLVLFFSVELKVLDSQLFDAMYDCSWNFLCTF